MNLSRFTAFLSQLPVRHRDTTSKMVPFRLFPNQLTAVKALAKQYEDKGKLRAIFLKSRRVTVSSLCDAYLFCDCLESPNRENLIVAHVKDTSEGLFRVPRDLANALNEKASICRVMAKRIEVQHREGISVLDIATAGTVASGRGLTLTNLHLSEAAFFPGQESFLSLLPAVGKGRDTSIFVESTANGTTGDGETFYQFWKQAGSRRSEYIQIFLGWLTDPAAIAPEEEAADAPATDLERELMRDFHASKSQIAWMRRTMENECQGYEKTFLVEYPHTPSVAFQSSGDPAFTPEERNFAESTVRDPIAQGHIEWREGRPQFVRNRTGALLIWEEPKPGHKYYIGMDAAVGLESGDFAAISIFDGTTGHQCAQYADKVVPEVVAYQMHCLGQWYNRALTNGELTGNSGREVLRVLRDHYMYPNFMAWKGKDDKLLGFGANRKPTVWWETTGYSRRKMIEIFRMGLRGGLKKDYFRAIVRDKVLWNQMADASLSETGRWELRHGHDDVLVSAMLAVVSYAQNPPPKVGGVPHYVDTGESEEDQLRRFLPDVIDDATLSLRRHYNKAMKMSKASGRREIAEGKRKLGIDTLMGV